MKGRRRAYVTYASVRPARLTDPHPFGGPHGRRETQRVVCPMWHLPRRRADGTFASQRVEEVGVSPHEGVPGTTPTRSQRRTEGDVTNPTATGSPIGQPGTTTTQGAPMRNVRIVIAQRGWVFIGRVDAGSEEVVISNARVIRRWGTTAGLGQLAEQGPQSGTTLDPAGTVRLHPLAIVAQIDVDGELWASALQS